MRHPYLCLLLAVACSHGTPSTSPTPVAPTPSRLPGAVAAVVTRGRLDTYRIGHGVATHVRTLAPPTPGATASSVSLSGGSAPVACAVWSTGALTCHDPDTGAGGVVAVEGSVASAAVSADGRWLAWASDANEPDVSYGRLSGTTVTDVVRIPAEPPGTPARAPEFGGAGVGTLAWSGADHLLVGAVRESDEGTALVDVTIAEGPRHGWVHGREVLPPRGDVDRGFQIYTVESAAYGGTAYALQYSGVASGSDVSRAVVLDLATGAARSVVAFADQDRSMQHVTGGRLGLVYVTVGRDAPRAYWRDPGAKTSVRVRGLPADSSDIYLQP